MVGLSDVQLFRVFMRAAERRVSGFTAQGLANAAWAFATGGHADAALFSTLAIAACWRVGDFKAQDLANTAWAFARAV